MALLKLNFVFYYDLLYVRRVANIYINVELELAVDVVVVACLLAVVFCLVADLLILNPKFRQIACLIIRFD